MVSKQDKAAGARIHSFPVDLCSLCARLPSGNCSSLMRPFPLPGSWKQREGRGLASRELQSAGVSQTLASAKGMAAKTGKKATGQHIHVHDKASVKYC